MTAPHIAKRYAMTALNATSDIIGAKHPALRGHIEHTGNMYDAALSRVLRVARRMEGFDLQVTAASRHEMGLLDERLERQALALHNVGKTIQFIPLSDVRNIPTYLQAAAGDIHQHLDIVEDGLFQVNTRTADAAGTGAGAGLRDVLQHILESAEGTAKLYDKVYKIPNMFRESLNPDGALTTLQEVFPAWDAHDKQAFLTAFEEGGYDVYYDKLKAADFSRLYELAVSRYGEELKNGVVRGGGAAAVSFRKKYRGGREQSIVLGSKKTKHGSWTVNLQLNPSVGVGLYVRFVLNSSGLSKVLMSLVKNARSLLQESMESSEKDILYQVEQLDDAIHLKEDAIQRSWDHGDVHISTSQGEDEGSAMVRMDLTRTVENDPPKDYEARRRYLLTLYGTNRTLLGGRPDAQKKAEQAMAAFGGEVISVEEIRESGGGVYKTGFRFNLGVPLVVDRPKFSRALADLAWSIGKGGYTQQASEEETTKLVDKFEKDFGINRTNSRRQLASTRRRVEQNKLYYRVHTILNSNSIMLSNKMRDQLERLQWGLQNGAIQDVNVLMVTLPARLDLIEEKFIRKATVQLEKLRGYLHRYLPSIASISDRLAAYGLTDVLPSQDDFIGLLTKQADFEVRRFGVAACEYPISFPCKGVRAGYRVRMRTGGVEVECSFGKNMVNLTTRIDHDVRAYLT